MSDEPAIDDIAQKTRRNLVLLSGGIWGVAVLGIPLDGKLIGVVNLGAVEPWRVWIVVIFVLAYLALRHWFAPHANQQWKEWGGRRRKDFQTRLADAIQRSVPGPAFDPDYVKYVVVFDLVRPPGEGWILANTCTARYRGRKGKIALRWTRSIPYPDPGETQGHRRVSEKGDALPLINSTYRVPLMVYARMHWDVIRMAYAPSWKLLELSFPWGFAAGAMLIAMFKLAQSLYYDFPFVRQLLTA